MNEPERGINGRRALFIWGPALALVYAGLTAARAGEDAAAHRDVAFEMQQVPVFGNAQDPDVQQRVRGQAGECGTEPDQQVKAYPKLKSKKPVYGSVTFGDDFYNPGSGITFHFVVDESGEAQEGEQDDLADRTDQAPSLLGTLTSALTGGQKESQPQELPQNTYDRFYFDANRDLDLTNDPVLTPMKKLPSGAMPSWQANQKVVFNYLTVPFDHGPELGDLPIRLMPRLIISEYEGTEYPGVYFVPTTFRKGRIEIGSRKYDAVLAQPYLVTGRFDRPYTGLFLTPVGSPDQSEHWWGADQISAMRLVDGQYYTTSTTPTGDKLIVQPYRGEFGLFEIGPGERDIDNLSISGSFRSKDAALAVGSSIGGSTPSTEKTRRCTLPVGDYLPDYVSLEYGRLRMSISNNYHSEGHPRDRQLEPAVYGISVRKDKPYVWDFSNKPEVMFASPARDQAFKPGDDVEVKAVLIDPVLDVMIRRLSDTARKEEKTVKLDSGGTQTYKSELSLDPTVTITSSSGERVAEGKLPFG